MRPADQMIAAVEAMLFLDRERVAEALLGHVRAHVLLNEARSRYDDVDDANDVVKFCREVLEAERAFMENMEAAESPTSLNVSPAA